MYLRCAWFILHILVCTAHSLYKMTPFSCNLWNLDCFIKESTEKDVVFIDLTLRLPGRNHKSSHIRTIYTHWLTSSTQTLPNTTNNGIKQFTKEKTFQLYQCCANNFFKQFFLNIFFLLTIFSLIFCVQTIYFTKLLSIVREALSETEQECLKFCLSWILQSYQ